MVIKYEYKYETINISILVGENAKENWDLISSAKQNYIWLHLNKSSSPHVIICYDYLKTPKQCIKYAASLCKLNSKYNNDKAKVIYTQVKNVKKTDVEGQVITIRTKII